ncbi:MAG: sirohydrochlorin cobaltochelatase [Clostridia bacterium]|nr:sirohydrochlorin cobaltochelatase [Clostridia bacterium]
MNQQDQQPSDQKKQSSNQSIGKKGILVVSFGTSYENTRKACIESVENKIAKIFPEYEIRRAFTSQIIIKKLAERDNIKIDNPKEALQKMKEEGFSEVIVQPLHIINGSEFEEIVEVVKEFEGSFDKLSLGRPILTHVKDYKIAVEAIKEQLPKLDKGQAVVFMGHGSEHPANSAYACLQSVINHSDLNGKVFIATVEGYPTLDYVIEDLKTKNINEVILMPFMLVAGDHAINDMAGDEEDSWKTILQKEGYVVSTYLHGLGENPAFQQIYIDHVKDTIQGEN